MGNDEEIGISNWAELAAVSPTVLWQLELEFLGALNWNVYVSNEEFFRKLQHVEMELAQQQGSARGWLTYTELAQLIPSMAVARSFVQYSTVFAVSYAASVFTIAGAFLLASQVPGTSLYHSTDSSNVSTAISVAPSATSGGAANDTAKDEIIDDDELMDRLRCPIDMLNPTIPPPPPLPALNNQTIILLNVVADHWHRMRQHRNRTDERRFLDESGGGDVDDPRTNTTEYLWPANLPDYPTKYDQFMEWMKLI